MLRGVVQLTPQLGALRTGVRSLSAQHLPTTSDPQPTSMKGAKIVFKKQGDKFGIVPSKTAPVRRPDQIVPGTQLAPDGVTHTGQAWDETDYRLVRFQYRDKQINPNIAARLVAEVPPLEVDSRIVSCDGGGGAMGHPKVYMNLDKPGNHICGYCGLRFTKKGQENPGVDHPSGGHTERKSRFDDYLQGLPKFHAMRRPFTTDPNMRTVLNVGSVLHHTSINKVNYEPEIQPKKSSELSLKTQSVTSASSSTNDSTMANFATSVPPPPPTPSEISTRTIEIDVAIDEKLSTLKEKIAVRPTLEQQHTSKVQLNTGNLR